MSKMVTRCPQCQTSFKVTEEHLKIANGAVRCGSCLHVFQARQHWVNPEAAASPAPSVKATAPATPVAPTPVQAVAPSQPTTKGTSKFIFDQSAIDNSSADSLLEEPDVRIPTTVLTQAHKKTQDIGDDDRISDDLLFDDDELMDDAPQVAGQTGEFGDPDDDYSSLFDEVNSSSSEESDDFDALLNGDFNDLDDLDNFTTPSDNSSGTSDESWAKELLSELEKEDVPEPVDLSQVEDGRKLLMDFTNPVDVDAARRDLGLDKHDPFAARELTGKNRTVGNQRAEMIAHIEPAPVELISGQQITTDWKSHLVWSGVSAFLFLLAIGQYLFFNFAQLAKADSTRPMMASLCHTLGCTLPAQEDWRNVRISNLIVRKHPQAANALAIDAILLNTSSHTLAFPAMELYFNNIEDIPIASRRFAPPEYLAGELAGQTQMPPGTPVHIAFEIVNPGSDAVNWNLQVGKHAP